jgi:outer membrane immunogenic protein
VSTFPLGSGRSATDSGAAAGVKSGPGSVGRAMRKVWVACVSFFSFVAPVCAADLPVIGPYYPVRPLYSWTGCSVGVNIGGGWSPQSFEDPTGNFGIGPTLGGHTANGAIGGWQLGCDYQAGPLVFGVRGLYDLTGIKGQNLQPAPPLANTSVIRNILANQSFIQWVGTLSGRAGVAIQPTTLLYVQGGGAWAHDVYNIFPFANQAITVGQSGPGITIAEGTRTAAGWTLGVGVEAALFGGDWSVFAEYDHIHFGSSNVTFTSGVVAGQTFPLTIRQSIDMFLLGINYRFIGGPPKF